MDHSGSMVGQPFRHWPVMIQCDLWTGGYRGDKYPWLISTDFSCHQARDPADTRRWYNVGPTSDERV